MAEWIEIGRVTLIVDTVIEDTILEHAVNAGARGYNCVQCYGRGRHETTSSEDPLSGRTRVRIEILAPDAVADAIMDYIHQPEFAAYPIVAYMDRVRIDARDQAHF